MRAQDGTKVISGGADKAARMLDVTTGQSSQIAVHDAPVKCIKWIDAPGQGLIATGSWDKVCREK
jgi:mRNA export factor